MQRSIEENFQRLFSGGGSETAVSDHKTLQLLTIQPDGSFTNQPIQSFDFDQTGCQGTCNDPGAGYIPNEVIPDGQGGLLATWTGNDAQLGITSSSAAIVRHFDNAGGTLDYAVPFASQSWFRIGGNNPQSLILGEGSTAWATDGQSILAFDVNNGSQLWSFLPGGFQGTALLGANSQGGLAAMQLTDFPGESDTNPNSLLSFSSTGTVTAIPFVAANSFVGYFDAETLLSVASNGLGQLVRATASLNLDAIWSVLGNLLLQRAAPGPHPINFRIIESTDEGGGVTALISETAIWDSSTGNPAALANCQVRENVTYPEAGTSSCFSNPQNKCFFAPSPPWPAPSLGSGYANPTIVQGDAIKLGFQDTVRIGPDLRFIKPYSINSFKGTQLIQYQCGKNSNTWTTFAGPFIITREIKTSAGKFVMTLSKTGISTTSSFELPGQ